MGRRWFVGGCVLVVTSACNAGSDAAEASSAASIGTLGDTGEPSDTGTGHGTEPGDSSGAAPRCDDGSMNGDETDIDCGGSCSACAPGQTCGVADDCSSGVCEGGVCCTTSSYERSTGLVSGSAMVCCDGDDERIGLEKCGDGQNYSADPLDPNCATTSEGRGNGGSACVAITCQAIVCEPSGDATCRDGTMNGDETGIDCGGSCPECPPYVGPAGPEVWSMAGVIVYDPKTFDPATYGPVLAANHFGWVALQIVDGNSEKWPCAAEPCGLDTARGWIAAWRPHVKWVGAWGVNRANADQAATEQEAQTVVDLLGNYDAAQAYVDFYIADAEAEYEYSKCGGCVSASSWWTARFREARPAESFEAALTSYGRTDLADLDWMIWRDRGFRFLPQTYWNDPNQGAAFAPAPGVDAALVCPGSQSAIDKGLDCTGSPTDCPCWPAGTIHPMIGFGWGDNPPTDADYVDSLAAAHSQFGSAGFSIFEGQYIPAGSAAWAAFGEGIANDGIAILP